MKFKLSIIIILLICCSHVFSQRVLVDEGIQVAGLQCFPVYGDSISYYYLPSVGALGVSESGLPEFSYLRYVIEKETENSDKGITDADGGAILHFLAKYTTPEEQIKKAEQELKQKVNNEIILKGPVIFKDARYTIVSSILTKSGKKQNKVITTGDAPIFQNSKLAFSFELEPKDSKLLLESFKMATPDISLIFEFTFSGLSEDFNGEVKVKWDEFQSSHTFGAGGSIYFIGADIEVGFEKLRKNNAIDVVTIGSNEHLEALMNTAYEKLLKLVFEPVKPESIPDGQKGDMGDALEALGSTNSTGFGINVSYQMKQLNFKGTSTLTFKGRQNVERKHFITFNIGDLYSKYGDNEKMFKDVSLYDPTFLQRDVYVGVDGSLQKEFDKMVNNVTVTMKKKHQDGSETLKELSVNKKTLDSDSRFIVSYLNHDDVDLDEWRKYTYQEHWQFVGGGEYKSEWKESGAGMINLFVPYKRKNFDLLGDLESASCESVRAFSIEIQYPFFGEAKSERKNIVKDERSNIQSFEITLPQNSTEISYSITAYKKDGTTINKKEETETGIIFIDDICKE